MTIDEFRAADRVYLELERASCFKREGARDRFAGKSLGDCPYGKRTLGEIDWESGWNRMDVALKPSPGKES